MDKLMASAASSSKRSKGSTLAEKPWVEKYRPRTTADVAHQSQVIATLRATISGADMPHLLFYGPPGTGKTSTILALSRELFGPQLMKERVLELNASDERGISVVREKIKTFASTSVSKGVDGYPCPPFKIIILDEADAMTAAAQSALRRTMEKYSNVTRFCLICNYISRIIEPLASRCAKFRFKPLSRDTLVGRLQHIRDKEDVQCSDEVLARIIDLVDGDMRQAITFLQSASRLCGSSGVEVHHVEEIAGAIPNAVMTDLLDKCRQGSFENLQETVQSILLDGFSADTIVEELLQLVVEADDISDTQKADIAHKLAQVDKRLVDGADEELQIMDLCATTMQVLS
ncbi:replication factor C 4 [Salpingoeca rosetta]|uniref:Replication factor C 4 n=1 Tax=Salpingoeca rosetta (strain ATCC 50818 / BSB-021) TaxID=946362 RepID=F2UFH6_SALR5|nr:replication factor C 4 [Salpingoeca rosetta]EGD75544.1 replication factor C 4 [Salpingoeca rosetta]|eukprot:XP_004992001.1 replication factor C 4 [Salpingoeca rosetta]